MEPDSKRRRCDREGIPKKDGKSKREINKMIDTLSLDKDIKKRLKYYNGRYYKTGKGRLSYHDGMYHGAHTELRLSGLFMDDDNISSLCEVFRNGYRTDELNLRFNSITSKGFVNLLKTLMECGIYLQKMDLLYNDHIDDECMEVLGEYIQFDNLLKSIHLGSGSRDTGITDKGIEIITDYIVGNTSLEDFYINNHGTITGASVPHLKRIARHSYVCHMAQTLRSLDRLDRHEVETCLLIPVEQRELPIVSNTKSAAKIG